MDFERRDGMVSMIILGIICLVCFAGLVVKYPLRKLGMEKANAFMMKLHEAVSSGLFLGGIAKIVIGVKKHLIRYPLAFFSGIAAFLADTVIITACHVTKDREKKMRDHRLLSLIATVLTVVHGTAVIIRKIRDKR